MNMYFASDFFPIFQITLNCIFILHAIYKLKCIFLAIHFLVYMEKITFSKYINVNYDKHFSIYMDTPSYAYIYILQNRYRNQNSDYKKRI